MNNIKKRLKYYCSFVISALDLMIGFVFLTPVLLPPTS
jgi:hypothetical protein